MLIQETKTRVITLDENDLKQAIIMYAKARAENDVDESNIKLDPEQIKATITLTETIEPK